MTKYDDVYHVEKFMQWNLLAALWSRSWKRWYDAVHRPCSTTSWTLTTKYSDNKPTSIMQRVIQPEGHIHQTSSLQCSFLTIRLIKTTL
jgi:hypothetical protein